METKNKYVSWRRVSTFKQSRSGLGLEAQKEIIRYFIERDKGEWIADYEECYTGKELSGCVELRKAINHAKREKAILIIAKSDRFRNTAEALQIYEEMGDGNIMFCDLPTSDKFSLTLFFALAEREALLVGIRTKQALAVKKAQGAKLGAASEKYKETMSKKSYDEIRQIAKKRGAVMRKRFAAQKDTQVFVKVLRRAFPDACEAENPKYWAWGKINTRGHNKVVVLGAMRDLHDFDNNIFADWDFDNMNIADMQRKLSGRIYALRRSYLPS